MPPRSRRTFKTRTGAHAAEETARVQRCERGAPKQAAAHTSTAVALRHSVWARGDPRERGAGRATLMRGVPTHIMSSSTDLLVGDSVPDANSWPDFDEPAATAVPMLMMVDILGGGPARANQDLDQCRSE